MSKKNTEPKIADIAIVMGSKSDWPIARKTAATLKSFGVSWHACVISAHRSPEKAADYAKMAAKRGFKIIIAVAGGSAHLAGLLAAYTTLPVIGIPVQSKKFNGLDSLLSTVQMPSGVPVATVGLGAGGAINAALLAVEILALEKPVLVKQLKKHKQVLKEKIKKANLQIQVELEKIYE